jgi:CRISPR-associated endonuclease/helicase Cas3
MSTNLPEIRLEDCWAKTWPKGHPRADFPALTIQDHSLAAGATAETLVRFLPPATRELLPDAAPLLCALHDSGKLTIGFQTKSLKWRPDIPLETLSALVSDSVRSHALLSEFDLLSRLPDRAKRWASAIGAHHGRYQNTDRKPHEALANVFGALRDELFMTLSEIFPGELPTMAPDPFDSRLAHSLFLFAGLVVFADWIASNDEFFPLGHSLDPAEARTLASRAISRLKIDQGALRELEFKKLFSSASNPHGITANALQLDCLARITRPGLYLIEAPMGDGKTEAALAAAYQLIRSGKARGIYFALPTQLTSNAIHRRLVQFLSNALKHPSPLALAHAAAWLADADQRLVRPGYDSPNPENFADEAARWFTSRRALLANFGVGTIDLALLAILPVKFHQLRCYGLAGKVVVFDEVHSYDAYTGSLLEILIDHLLHTGSTVLVLSATLAAPQRKRLLAISENIGVPGDSIRAAARAPKSIRIEAAVGKGVDDDLLAHAVTSARRGACVLWIRNTVDLAQSTYSRLANTRHGDSFEIGLLHSRFTLRERHGDPADPADIGREDRWVERLGKHALNRPRGCVLVSTQIAEQSLDIDADVLITDLAPTDMLWQRIGRLHRHPRNRPPGFEEPVCHVHFPEIDPSAEASLLKSVLKPHSLIYDPFVLLLSHRLWRSRTSVQLPEDIEPMVDSTYPDGDQLPPDLPASWSELHAELQKRIDRHSHKAMRGANPRAWPQGGDDELIAATRLNGIRYIPVVLLRSRLVRHGPLCNTIHVPQFLAADRSRLSRSRTRCRGQHAPYVSPRRHPPRYPRRKSAQPGVIVRSRPRNGASGLGIHAGMAETRSRSRPQCHHHLSRQALSALPRCLAARWLSDDSRQRTHVSRP